MITDYFITIDDSDIYELMRQVEDGIITEDEARKKEIKWVRLPKGKEILYKLYFE